VKFLDLPDKSRRAAFAKMDAADKAKKGAKLSKPKKSGKRAAPAKKAAAKGPSINPSQQVSRQYTQTGKPTAQDVDTLIANYKRMHGKDPSPAQLAKLRRKRR
jgi:hypothetical protein